MNSISEQIAFSKHWRGELFNGTPTIGWVEVSSRDAKVVWSEESDVWPAYARSGGSWEQSFEEILCEGPSGGTCPDQICEEVVAFVKAHSH